MPANLSPEYKKAEQAFRTAREPRERLDCLKDMLRTVPPHAEIPVLKFRAGVLRRLGTANLRGNSALTFP